MSRHSRNDYRPAFNSISKICFCIASLAFVGSFACAAIHYALSGWMAVAGMAGLGLFYLALGVLNLGHAPTSLFDDAQNSSSAALHSRVRRQPRRRIEQLGAETWSRVRDSAG